MTCFGSQRLTVHRTWRGAATTGQGGLSTDFRRICHRGGGHRRCRVTKGTLLLTDEGKFDC